MKIDSVGKPFEMLVIQDTFSEQELQKIWVELEYLHSVNSFISSNINNSAVDHKGKVLKQNKSLFLDSFYSSRDNSTILSLLQKKLFSHEVVLRMMSLNPAFNNFKAINKHTTLISYYENSDFYKPHTDSSVFSTLTYIYKEPKSFTGGDISFYFNEEKIKINIENNLSIMFPSGYLHEVDPVIMNNNNVPISGRHCLSMFTGICIHA